MFGCSSKKGQFGSPRCDQLPSTYVRCAAMEEDTVCIFRKCEYCKIMEKQPFVYRS